MMKPGSQCGQTRTGVIILSIVGPLAQGGLDEALGLAVGTRGIGPGEDVLEPELLAGLGKGVGDEAGTVVGHDRLHLDAETSVVNQGSF